MSCWKLFIQSKENVIILNF